MKHACCFFKFCVTRPILLPDDLMLFVCFQEICSNPVLFSQGADQCHVSHQLKSMFVHSAFDVMITV